MISKNLAAAQKNTFYLVKEKYGMLYLDCGADILTQLFRNAKIDYDINTRANLRSYILNTRNLSIHLNGVILSEEAYNQNLETKSIPDFLLSKGISHGVEHGKIDFNGLHDEIGNYNEYLKEKFNYFKQALNATFVHITENFSMIESGIKLCSEESITTKAFRLANLVRRIQEAGLSAFIDINFIDQKSLAFDELFFKLEKIMTEIYFAFNDNDILWEGLTFALPILGANKINHYQKGRRISYEEIAIRNLISWKRCIVPAVQILYLKFDDTNTSAIYFNECCLLLNEIAKIDINKPWVISYAMGGLLYGNSMLYWKNEQITEDLASGLVLRRIEAVRAAMGGEFRSEMAKESTFENNVKEISLIKKVDITIQTINKEIEPQKSRIILKPFQMSL